MPARPILPPVAGTGKATRVECRNGGMIIGERASRLDWRPDSDECALVAFVDRSEKL